MQHGEAACVPGSTAGERVCRAARRTPVKRLPHGRKPWGLGGLVGWTLLEKHPSLTAGHPAALARAVLAKRRELR
jgi:hypothetical protein